MEVTRLDYTQLKYWNHTDLAYISHDPALREFYAHEALKSSVQDAIRERKNFGTDRDLLASVLKKQYSELNLELPISNEVILDHNMYTITTAHQPTLFTGPLFHIYKIASAIHMARDLTASTDGITFIPFFIINAEDHDWAEVNHFHLFGRKYEWDRQSKGPSGRLPVEGLDVLIKSVIDLFSNAPNLSEIKDLLNDCFQKAKNYSEFHRLLLHHVFGGHGLVILDMDDVDLKRAFIPLMEKEIKEQFSFKPVSETQSALEKAGFKPQAFCRPINLFYMTDEIRERIEPHEDGVIRVESKIKYSTEEIIQELQSHPDRFSPNVIMRPLFEEYILPNIAYIGGGGEIAYWLERKTQFAIAGIPFPMLVRRNSLLIVDGQTDAQLKKLKLNVTDTFPDYDSIVKTYLRKNSQNELTYDGEMEMIKKAYDMLAAKADHIDATLATAMRAEQSKQLKQFEQLGSRLLRSEKQVQDTDLKKIQRLKEKLFPNGGLQERHENFLSFYANYGSQFTNNLVEICDPFEEKFMILQLQDSPPSQA
ncbi:MAG TPA: bacillithiol biosynthesis cysteine-adding enzyme BshC [Saprospiraceae bacterium]|nr:bacillithiol biosynthesis cysteine-adding enzyme BshC [Saprospiraceae bacterium]